MKSQRYNRQHQHKASVVLPNKYQSSTDGKFGAILTEDKPTETTGNKNRDSCRDRAEPNLTIPVWAELNFNPCCSYSQMQMRQNTPSPVTPHHNQQQPLSPETSFLTCVAKSVNLDCYQYLLSANSVQNISSVNEQRNSLTL